MAAHGRKGDDKLPFTQRTPHAHRRFSSSIVVQSSLLPYILLGLLFIMGLFVAFIHSGFDVAIHLNTATKRLVFEQTKHPAERNVSATTIGSDSDANDSIGNISKENDKKSKQQSDQGTVVSDGRPLCPNGVPDVYTSMQDTNLTRDSLIVDFAAWEGREYTLENVKQLAEHFKGFKSLVALIQIKNNQLTFPNRDDDCTNGCDMQLVQVKNIMRKALVEGLINLPDTEFVVNVHDFGKCPKDEPKCVAPIFSYNRRLEGFIDILIPNFQPPFQSHFVPWDEKIPKAFFRGTPYCSGDPHSIAGQRINCSRLVLTDMAKEYPEYLNVSISGNFTTDGYTWVGTPGYVSAIDQAKYQMLLSLDGFTASSRLTMLLGINSVVLKQASPHMEYYGRSLKPCVHYLPFWEREQKDILEVIKGVIREPKTAQKIAANAQAFALANLNFDARLQYWARAIREYDRRLKK